MKNFETVDKAFIVCYLNTTELYHVIKKHYGRSVDKAQINAFGQKHQYFEFGVPLGCEPNCITDILNEDGDSIISQYYDLDTYEGIISFLRDVFNCNHPQIVDTDMAFEFEQMVRGGDKLVQKSKHKEKQLELFA